jgi:pimeloyl-ACP methyl ester carboxylesterase
MMRKNYVDIPEGQVHYRSEGTGYPVILLHQNPVSSADYIEVIPVLARHYRVLAMDTMGYGMSDPPPPNPLVTDYARHVKEFASALGIKKAHFVAHHTGSTIAVEVAAAYPELVDKLVISGMPYFDPETRRQGLARLKASSPIKFTDDGSYIMEFWNRIRHYNPHSKLDHTHSTLAAAMVAGQRREDAHIAIFLYDEQKRLPLVESPTLLISGSVDTFIDQLAATAQLIPHCTTKVIPGGASDVLLAMPQEFCRLVLDFLK